MKLDIDYVLFDEALALKNLGFDVPVTAKFSQSQSNFTHLSDPFNSNLSIAFQSAPTYQQAFRWIRNNFKLSHYIDAIKEDYNEVVLRSFGEISLGRIGQEFSHRYSYKTYEEAELMCLKKLIEIINNSNK